MIELKGPNPKVVRVAKTSGLKGVKRASNDNADADARVDAIVAEQRTTYEKDIKVRDRSHHELYDCFYSCFNHLLLNLPTLWQNNST